MVSAILLHYVVDDPLPTRGTFGGPGSNPDSDNLFFFWSLHFVLFSHMLSSFYMLLLHKLLFNLVCMVAS